MHDHTRLTTGEDRFLIDIMTGEQVFIEAEGGRKYRLGSSGGKLYEDEKPKKKCRLPSLPLAYIPLYRIRPTPRRQVSLRCRL